MPNQYKNLILSETSSDYNYSPPRKAQNSWRLPERERTEHYSRLRTQFDTAWQAVEASGVERQAVVIESNKGRYIEFHGQVGQDLVTQSLEARQSGIRLLNINEETTAEGTITKAVIYVPNGKEHIFLNKLDNYGNPEKDTLAEGKPPTPKNDKLMRSIESIQAALIESLWTSDITSFPDSSAIWCEIWLQVNDIYDKARAETQSFFDYCTEIQLRYKEDVLLFPERCVVLILANRSGLQNLLRNSPIAIAEIRKAPEVVEDFFSLERDEQLQLLESAITRIKYEDNELTKVCLLDQGVNNSHPLISLFLSAENTLSVNPAWLSGDTDGHGTKMAGLILYPDLGDFLLGNENIHIPFSLESVKLLNRSHPHEPESYGFKTQQAANAAYVQNANANRIVCMAITGENEKELDGRPSSWSAAIDSLCAGAFDGNRYIFLVSAGNTTIDEVLASGYPDANLLHSVENPAQAWNAVTVGAYTKKALLDTERYPQHTPLASPDSLSPHSSTSLNWAKKWPLKPDIVCEGGNMARDVHNNIWHDLDDLSLLTTSHQITREFFSTLNGTSAATALAANIAAKIYAAYPELQPETIRALLIHSAEWTEEMKKTIKNGGRNRSDYNVLLATCGYGVPNIDRALYCLENHVNMIIEDEIQPFIKTNSQPKLNQMNIHELPWPSDLLQELGTTDVRLKVTLSYYIEPSPGEIGWKDKYRYPSAGLRFDVNNPQEERDGFLARINKLMRSEDESLVDNDANRWILGTNHRDKGSIHSDSWTCTAADLSRSNYIAVYPVGGWWKLRPHLRKYNQKVKYSLVVSLHTPEQEVDLYTPIVAKAKVATAIEIPQV